MSDFPHGLRLLFMVTRICVCRPIQVVGARISVWRKLPDTVVLSNRKLPRLCVSTIPFVLAVRHITLAFQASILM
ncbi:hypothetical protein BCR43DRAFT_497132 [Syncephalastrum racemosum]|uniref:Uncharacterized protein n=1 Tax=Syncephalastrum racemosum TaxID=13706 RepID=A0A1X2H588_SYNRA|nr:hypothetical protein BCR43DRAFT_497132 [Syncephalastrum racemosum]